jgi:hypothetical protein
VVAVVVRVQLAVPEKLPVPELEKLTVPVGVEMVPLSVSVTVAVQVVGEFTATEEGKQLTLVAVVRAACAGVAVAAKATSAMKANRT